METSGNPPCTGLHARLERLRRYEDRPAYLWKEGVRWRSRTYATLHGRILSCASLLAREGIAPGAPVLIQGPGHPAWVEALLGTFLSGGVAVPLDESSPAAFRDEVARRTGSRLLIAPPGIPPPPGCRRIDFGAWPDAAAASQAFDAADPGGDRTAEVVFTSGTTGDPRGVVLTHANLASDFAPIERGFLKRESLIRPLGAMRFLTTLPLSHMFGQAMNVFLPLYMGLAVVFVQPRPREILGAARRTRAWGLFTVPRLLDLLGHEVRRVLREEGNLEAMERRQERLARWPFYLQSLLFWRIQRIFGARFRLLVSGGAPLPEGVQRFWERSGYLVVQGYGLTETAPIVSISNPFERRAGSVGRPMGIQEVILGEGNEVLVRGPNVTRGYFGTDASAGPPGWFRTGDVGELDTEGRLRIRGRLKDLIVTPEGEKVYPEDVEPAFARLPGVLEACVLGVSDGGGERVHAVLLMEAGADPEEAVRAANERLQPRQRIRDYTVWGDEDLPRTSTGKVRKGVVRERILAGREKAGEAGPAPSGVPESLRRLVARVAGTIPERIDEKTRLVETLGLASLDLVELAGAVEEEFGVVLPDEILASATVGDLQRAVREIQSGGPAGPGTEKETSGFPGTGAGAGESPPEPAHPGPRPGPGKLRMPRWARSAPVHLLRRLLEEALYRPVVLFQAKPEVIGLEHLRKTDPPYLFVCNHRSHLDTGLFKTVLPRHLRGRIAPAMTTRYHRVFFGEIPGGALRYLKEWIQVRLVEWLFCAWPLPETAAFRRSLDYAGELADAGWSLLIFPEGRHVSEGTLGSFRRGIGIFARDLRVPVVPACVEGTALVLPEGARWLRYGRTRLVLGEPFLVDPEADPYETAKRLEEAVRKLRTVPGPE